MTEQRSRLHMNKKGLRLKNAFFAIVAVSMVIAAVGIIVGEWNVAYDTDLANDLGEFNTLQNISAEANRQQGRISPNDPDPGTNFEANTFRGVYGIISDIYRPFRIVFGDSGLLDSVTERFGLPDYVRQGLVTMFIFAFTFSIVAIVFRLGRTAA